MYDWPEARLGSSSRSQAVDRRAVKSADRRHKAWILQNLAASCVDTDAPFGRYLVMAATSGLPEISGE